MVELNFGIDLRHNLCTPFGKGMGLEDVQDNHKMVWIVFPIDEHPILDDMEI
jgi:hypothetical protein